MKFNPEQLRAIFGNPAPPKVVWEKQFDGFDNELAKVGRKHWQDVTEGDLWYYFHDLTYMDLQPDLFAHLFPVCLKFWYDTLMRNESAELGGSDFHNALHRSKILEKMVTLAQREAIHNFMHDAFVERLEQERGFIYSGSRTPAYGWIYRFNSLGLATPLIERIWKSWWNFDHPGKAVCAIMWASGLIYLPGENPIFAAWTPDGGGGEPHLVGSDASIYDSVWLPENLEFLESNLTCEYLDVKINEAAVYLRDEPEGVVARKVADDIQERGYIVTCRIQDLLKGLASLIWDQDNVW